VKEKKKDQCSKTQFSITIPQKEKEKGKKKVLLV